MNRIVKLTSDLHTHAHVHTQAPASPSLWQSHSYLLSLASIYLFSALGLLLPTALTFHLKQALKVLLP